MAARQKSSQSQAALKVCQQGVPAGLLHDSRCADARPVCHSRILSASERFPHCGDRGVRWRLEALETFFGHYVPRERHSVCCGDAPALHHISLLPELLGRCTTMRSPRGADGDDD
jgi:hypothetical protein